jgi:hypothetical protein
VREALERMVSKESVSGFTCSKTNAEVGIMEIVYDCIIFVILCYDSLQSLLNVAPHGEMYLIQHYVIKFVSDLQQVGGFLQILQFPPPIKLTGKI